MCAWVLCVCVCAMLNAALRSLYGSFTLTSVSVNTSIQFHTSYLLLSLTVGLGPNQCEHTVEMILLPPATKLGQGYIFTGVCDSVHGGGSASVHAGYPPPPGADPPGADTPPRADTPLGADPPLSRPPGADTPDAKHAGRYGQHAGGMHPTGMQSRFKKKLSLRYC